MVNWKPVFNTSLSDGPMNVICFGSGSGTTIEAILAEERRLKDAGQQPYRVRAIVANRMCRCVEIAREKDIPLVMLDRTKFFIRKGTVGQTEEMAVEYEKELLQLIRGLFKREGFSVDLVALAGYSSILRKPLLEAFGDRIINSHPADLSILLPDGTRKYKGLYGSQAILKAILDGEKSTKTCIHMVTEEVDGGEILVSSRPLEFFDVVEKLKGIENPEVRELALKAIARYHQELQKKDCDYPAYLAALRLIAEGRIGIETGKSAERKIFLDGKQLGCEGVQLE